MCSCLANQKIYLLLILTFSIIDSYCQATISGNLEDTDGEPLPYVNVLLLNETDSLLLKGYVSNPNGFYKIVDVLPGRYLLSFSMVGYQMHYSGRIDVNMENQEVKLGVTKLKELVTVLGEVVVEAKKPLFEQQIDRMVVNVQSDVTNAGATALDVLEKSPGVNVDRQNGGLSLMGKSGVRVMINGKISRVPMATVVQML
ncbi:MAG: carboxypeptidase-like regulatory domain-containing protein, partial [Cyclobacteriaceae bacterium]|nr:carboxypeptidase-like regulatory domain-containing protein [Cyclobacteriaceae bacterium]